MTKTTPEKQKRAYDRQKAAKTRRINKELKSMGLPTLQQQRKGTYSAQIVSKVNSFRRSVGLPPMKKAGSYNYNGKNVGRNGKKPRKFSGALGENMKMWAKRSKYISKKRA